MDAYKELTAVFEKVYRLQHLVALGGWDAQTMMPPKGVAARGAALGELQRYIHTLIANPHTESLIEQAASVADSLNEVEQANVREAQLVYMRESALSDEFVAAKAEASAQSRSAWIQARKVNDFQMFLPHLKRMVELAREEARYRAAKTGKGTYESLFNMYEPGMSLERLEEVFDDVKSWLPELLRAVTAKRADIQASIVPLQTPLPIEKQVPLNEHLAKVWGYDFDMGRLDIAAHPFTGMVPEDSRITTHYSDANYAKSVFATIHEVGHSKYNTHLGPHGQVGQPVSRPRSQTIHESQSRFQECMLARSGACSEFMTPLLKEYLGDQPAFTEENVRKINHFVEPGFIRVAADEVCYPLHILLRYEIERALVEGTMEAEDLPRVWNEKMQSYLGQNTEGRDDIGCMQDVHWSQGMFGYFPTYSLGSFFAAQLFATIKNELGEDVVEKCMRTGRLQPIFDKQEEKIWSKGSLYETEELMVKATGERLNTQYFREHLERRYLRNEE